MRPTLLVLLVVALVTPGALTTTPAAAAEGGDYLQVVDLTFPADPRVHFSDTYDACRSDCERVHKATDLMGEKMWPVYATVDGVVCRLDDGEEDGYGRHLTLCGDDGRRYRYLHLNNDTPGTDDGAAAPEHVYAPGIQEGGRVARGQHLAFLGDSGNAEESGAHLHLDVFDDTVVDPYGDNRINPYPSLMAALARGDVPDGTAFYADPGDRAAGEDRVATAIALARTTFASADAAILAPWERPGEAIVAGPLANALDAPVLTTRSDALDLRVADELERLGVTSLYLVGDLLPDVEDGALAGTPVDPAQVVRLAGNDLFETAALVAEQVWELTGAGDPLAHPVEGEAAPAGDHPEHDEEAAEEDSGEAHRTALVALGAHTDPTRSWPDSLMASYYGSALERPVLLVDEGGLPRATADALAGVVDVTVIGGPAAVDHGVVAMIDDLAGTVTRLAGSDRYATAVAVTDALLERGLVSDGRVWAATGRNWPDAATAGPVVFAHGDVLVLVDGDGAGADQAARAWLEDRRRQVTEAIAIGGPAAISDTVLAAFRLSIT